MQKIFQKTPLFLSVAFFVFSCLVFIYLFGEINRTNMKSQLAENEWQTEASRRDELRSLDHSVRIIEQERTQLETHFAQSSDIVPFLDTIEGLAKKAGTNAEIVSVDVLEDNAGLAVGMKASGTFGNLYKFLTLLENSPYELEFIGMELQKISELDTPDKNTQAPKWDLNTQLKLLSFIK